MARTARARTSNAAATVATLANAFSPATALCVAAPPLSQLPSPPLNMDCRLLRQVSMQWLVLPGHAPATPQRPSQVVLESAALDETGQHEIIIMERVSTGGTRYSRQFQRQQTDGPMRQRNVQRRSDLRQHCSRTNVRLPAPGMRAGSEMQSGEYGRILMQSQRTIRNVK